MSSLTARNAPPCETNPLGILSLRQNLVYSLKAEGAPGALDLEPGKSFCNGAWLIQTVEGESLTNDLLESHPITL